MTQCSNCKDAVGNDTKVMPFYERNGEKLVDTWCPQCWCYHRVLLEPERYAPGMHVAVACGRCGWTTINHGLTGGCGQCGNRAVRVLKPKEHAGTLLQE